MSGIAFYGLGSMGFGMAESLLRAGLDVTGHDVNEAAVARLAAKGGGRDAPASAEIIVICVVNAAQTSAVLDSVLPELKAGAVVIACATMPPEFAREAAACVEAAGGLYLDAPISGGAQKAADGALTIMASGAPAAFDAAAPALDAMAEKVFRLGDGAGAGSAMKIVNQLLAGVHIAAAAEAMTFGAKMGVEPAQCLEVISECAGSSWMFENRGPHIVDGDYTPRSAVEIFVKDLGIVSDIARGERFAAPLAATALQQFIAAAGMGLGGEDDAAVAKVYARNAGIKLPGDA